MKRSIAFLTVACAVAALDGAGELLFIFVFAPPGVAVSCCTAVADLAIPPAPLLPAPLLSVQYHQILMAGYHGFNLGFMALLGFFAWGKRTQGEGINRSWRLIIVAIIALLNCTVTYGAFKEYLGPRLMHLPDHHCLYCLLQYRPVSIVILGLFILGSFSAMWPALLNRITTSIEAREHLARLNRRLIRWAIACLFASWLMVLILA